MAGKDERRRIAIDLPLVKQIRLYLWASTRGLTKTEMAERIIIDRVSTVNNWSEVIRDLRQEAAIYRMSISEYVASVLKDEFKDLAVEEIDWTPLLEPDSMVDVINRVDGLAAKKGVSSEQIWNQILKVVEELE